MYRSRCCRPVRYGSRSSSLCYITPMLTHGAARIPRVSFLAFLVRSPRDQSSRSATMRRHGWQLPLHPLQFVGMALFSFLVVAFYVLLGPFLGNRIVENTVLTLFSFTTFSVAVLYVRCTAIDPSDKTNIKLKTRAKHGALTKLNYKFMLYQIVVRFLKSMEKKILKCCLRRKYLDPRDTNFHMDPLLPFPLVEMDNSVAPHLKDDISFCSLCDFEVKKHSKHCKSCNRCVDGFDHHCRWLNNCIGRKNYTTFILLLIFVLLMLIVEGGSAVAIFIRCLADSRGISWEQKQKLHVEIPKGFLATISAVLALLSAYGTIALGQLFFFHVVLIKKGMRTYDYISAMREEMRSSDIFDDLDLSSDESVDLSSPETPNPVSRFLCRDKGSTQSNRRLSIRIDKEPNPSTSDKKADYRIDPWKLIKMSKEKALQAAERARERMKMQPSAETLKPLPAEIKRGPAMDLERKLETPSVVTPVATKLWFPGSPVGPRRRFSSSSSPKPQKYRNNFDLKLTEVSSELETHISRQVLCSVLKQDEDAK